MNGKNSIGQFTKDAFNKLSKDELWCILSNLQMDNERLRNENLELKELKKLYETSPFTPSSEQMMYLFQEVEALDEMDRKNLEKIHVDSYEKAARKKRECTQLPAGTPVYDVDHTEGSPDTIELDGILFNRIEDKVVEKVATIPASQVIERHHYAQYAPADVYDKSLKHEVRFLNPVVDKIAASPSFIADIVIVAGRAADHSPKTDYGVIFSALCHFRCNQRDFKCARNPCNMDILFLYIVPEQAIHSAGKEFCSNELVETSCDNAHFDLFRNQFSLKRFHRISSFLCRLIVQNMSHPLLLCFQIKEIMGRSGHLDGDALGDFQAKF